MDDRRTALNDLPLLTFVPAEVRSLVVNSFVGESFAFGSSVVREGDQADAFYVLAAGRARVVKAGRDGEEISLNVLRPGDSFGEVALLERTTRAATVRASSDVEVFRLDRGVFDALVNNHPEIRQYLELHVRHRSLQNFFRIYSPFTQLPPDSLEILIRGLESVTAEKGERVIRQGDAP